MMGEVFVMVDNREVGIDSVGENNVYTITVRNLNEGNHQLAVIAYDAAGNMARKDVPLVIKKLATGEACTVGEACVGGICAQSEDGNFCTQNCDLSASTCPEDFECSAEAGGTVCIPTGGVCGCATSGNPGPMILLALGLGGVLLRRRRR
jgi:MYXO-CTERM domain-containing protein